MSETLVPNKLSSEELARRAKMKLLGEKVYYHRTPGAKFYMFKGEEIAFAGGKLELSSIPESRREEVAAELDKIADVPTSHIYTKQQVVDPGETLASSEIMETAEHHFDGDHKITGQAVTVPIPVGKQEPPELSSLAKAKIAVAGAGAGTSGTVQSAAAAAKK